MSASAASHDIRRDLVALLPRLRRFALTLVGDGGAADDLVRDVCLRAIDKSHLWKAECRLESWVFSLIRSTWDDTAGHRRDTGRQETDGDGSQAEFATAFSPALSCLSNEKAVVLLLIDVENFDYVEASSILGISAADLATRLCAARMALSTQPAARAERRA